MNAQQLLERLRGVCFEPMPLPAHGETALRHRRLMQFGREDLSLARLAEAHFDATSILAEARRPAEPGALYGVWASEMSGQPLRVAIHNDNLRIDGTKMFCSGAGIVDRALVTVEAPDPLLVDIDLRAVAERMHMDTSQWKTAAFALTNTATVVFHDVCVSQACIIGERGWYLRRPGFWHGALGPAACWAGGALGILDYVHTQSRSDPHTLAHRGAMATAAWAMQAALKVAGDEIDNSPGDFAAANARALMVRHLIEQNCSEILQRFGRAYGPYPLAFVSEVSARHQELTLYLRQCHADRDMATLANLDRIPVND